MSAAKSPNGRVGAANTAASIRTTAASPTRLIIIVAEKHAGKTESDNLCLAYAECNPCKGGDLCSFDAETATIVSPSHPRQQHWTEHFRIADGVIEALAPAPVSPPACSGSIGSLRSTVVGH